MTAAAWLFILAAAAPIHGGAAQSGDAQTILNHRLTMDLVKQTVAVDRDLLALLKTDPGIVKRATPRDTRGIDATAKELERLPEVAAVLKANGISARDYMLTTMSLFSTTVTFDLIAKGRLREAPPGMPTHNFEFLKANHKELEPLVAEWKKNREEIAKYQ